MKTTVIHHKADYDGIFCREIARKFLPEAELIGWDFADPPLEFPTEGQIYILDLPVDRVFGFTFGQHTTIDKWPDGLQRCIWIDHHKSSIESHPTDIPGYRIDGVAACRLAWQWFCAESLETREGPVNDYLPNKEAFINRQVTEPLAVRLAGEYDIWDKRDPDAETLQYALRASPITPVGWAALFDDDRAFVNQLLVDGRTCQRYAQDVDASVVKSRSFKVQWEGLTFLALNTARCNSLTFAALDVPETGHDALMGFYWNGEAFNVSLYHAKHRTDLDLSQIAVKHGGGGHRGACGFRSKTLPFVEGGKKV